MIEDLTHVNALDAFSIGSSIIEAIAKVQEARIANLEARVKSLEQAIAELTEHFDAVQTTVENEVEEQLGRASIEIVWR